MNTVEIAETAKRTFDREPIAIVGVGCRFPGGVDSPQGFWDLIANGRDGIVEVPGDRWSLRKFYDPDPEKPGKIYTKNGGFLRDPVDRFDGRFFGVSPREAESMDPQQRLLLEVAWEAFEDGGQLPETLAGSDTGVYIGAFTLDNKLTQMGIGNQRNINSHTAVSSTMTILSNRLSYFFDLHGPSISIDTACSSSLVALHYACQDIWRGQCQKALAGGVNVIFRPEYAIGMCKGKFLAPDGRSKSFDSRANGYARGEGAGVLLLEPLSVAQERGDPIYSVICGTGVNQDGRTDGITVPNPNAQRTLIEKVIDESSIDTKDIRYFEAHGTGTPVGDPIEAAALGSVIGRDRDDACPIGSVKANIGHLEAASGVAGVIKTALCLRERKIPPLANLEQANPNIPFDELRLRLPRQLEDMTVGDGPAHAGVNSFGYGGTNAHVILREPPSSDDTHRAATSIEPGGDTAELKFVLPVSAKSDAALYALAESYAEIVSDTSEDRLLSICSNAAMRRTHHDHRFLVRGNTPEEIVIGLDHLVGMGRSENAQPDIALTDIEGPVFVYTGMGPQWWGMGRELLAQSTVFADAARECDAVFRGISGWSIIEEISKDEQHSRIKQTDIAQPANFLIQMALTALWRSLGIEPQAVVGHSVGEVSSAYVSGVLSLEDALTVSYHRSRIQKKSANQGSMLAAAIDENRAEEICSRFDEISIAAINAPEAVTLAGNTNQLEALAKELEGQGIFQRMLDVEVPYHSHLMDPLLPELLDSLADIKPNMPAIALYSTVTGEQVNELTYDAAYWARNVREPVYFEKSMGNILLTGHRLFLEVGPHPVLSTSIRECASAGRMDIRQASSLRRKDPEWPAISDALAALYSAGCPVDWSKFYGDGHAFVRLPTYPWQRQDRWLESDESYADRCSEPEHPLLGERSSSPGMSWEAEFSSGMVPYIDDHHVDELKVVAGASYVEIGLAIQKELSDNSVGAVLENLQFEQAMIVAANEDRIVLSSFDQQQKTFSIGSRSSNSVNNWQRHAVGRIGDSVEVPIDRIDPGSIEKRCLQNIDPQTHFLNMQNRGLTYGPAFQGIVSLSINSVTQEVLARVQSPEAIASEVERYQLHPALLDACFQALLAAVDTNDTYVPVSIRQIRLFRSPPLNGFWCHGEACAAGDSWLDGNLRLFDDDGGVIAEIRGVRAQRLTDKHAVSLGYAETCLYEFDWIEQQTSVSVPVLSDSWLIIEDASSPDDELLRSLAEAGVTRTMRVSTGDELAIGSDAPCTIRAGTQSDLQAVLSKAAQEGIEAILDLRGLHVNADAADAVGLNAVTDTLQLVQTMSSIEDGPKRLVMLTKGGQVFDQDRNPKCIAQSSLIGLLRVAMNEFPDLRFRCIDLDPNIETCDWQRVLPELGVIDIDCEEEVAFRRETRWVHRLNAKEPEVLDPRRVAPALGQLTLESPLVLEAAISDAGSLTDSEESTPFTRYTLATDQEPSASEIEISVQAISLNCNSSMEIGGLVTKVGTQACEMTEFKVGDLLSVPWHKSATTRALISVHKNAAVMLPRNCELDQFVVNIDPYATVWFALHRLQSISTGQRVLIHSGDSLLGRAAIRIARLAGAKVYASTSNERNRQQLIDDGADFILPATATELSEQLRDLTDGEGVSIALIDASVASALPAERVLCPFGRYLVFDGEENQVVAGAGGGNYTYTAVSSRQLSEAQPEDWCRSREVVSELLAQNVLSPFEFDRFDSDRFCDAQAQALDISNAIPAIVTIDSQRVVQAEASADADRSFDAQSTHLITGGFGGFGLAVANWLVEKGVRSIVLVGRRGAATPGAEEAIASLNERGARVRAEAVDIADADQVRQLIQRVDISGAPLVGVWHTAAVFDDAPFMDMNGDRLKNVLNPKSTGAWNLHVETASLPIEQFVLFSSIASYIGSPGQASYVASNCFLDALAMHRQSIGLAGSSVSWGALAEVGVVSRYQEIEQYLERVGSHRLTPAQAMHMLERVAFVQPANIAVADVDWQLWSEFHPAWARSNRFSHLIDRESDEANGARSQFLLSLEDKSEDERCEEFEKLIVGNVASVMRLTEDNIRPQDSLIQMGLDSLMAMELQSRIEKTTAIKFSTLELMKGNSIAELAETLTALADSSLSSVVADDAPAHSASVKDAAASGDSHEVDVENIVQHVADLSDEEVDRLLGQLVPSSSDNSLPGSI